MQPPKNPHHVFLQQYFSPKDLPANITRRFLHSMCVSHVIKERSPRRTCFGAHLTLENFTLAPNTMNIPAMHSITALRLKFLAAELTNSRAFEDIQSVARNLFARACRVIPGLMEELVNCVTLQTVADFPANLTFDLLTACLLIAQPSMTLELI